MTGLSNLTKPVRLLFVGYGINMFGMGLTMPYLMVYLHVVRHLPLLESGLVLSTSSLAGLLAVPTSGWAVDRYGTLKVLVLALLAVAIGTMGYSLVYVLFPALLAAVCSGAGGAAMWATLNARMAELTDESNRAQVFGLAYAVQNLGLGLGSGVSGMVVHTRIPASFVTIFLLDAATYLIFIPFIIPGSSQAKRLRERAQGGHLSVRQETAGASVRTGYGDVLRDRGLLGAAALNALFVTFGFSQLTSSFPTWAVGFAGVGTRITGFAFFANCIVIALIQLPILRLTASWRRTRAAAMAGVGFALAWLVVVVAGRGHGGWTAGLLIAALSVFGIAETFLSPSLSPLVNNLAPASLRGRYNAVFGLSWQVGSILGPALAGVALGQGDG
ncbi:MFS transporter, partial [Alicyclobacillaceae bacterium I2511]